jgi:hypothetical protein
MPVVIAWIGRLLLTVGGEILIRALIGGGIGLATYAVQVNVIRPLIAARFAAAGPLAAYIGALGIDVFVTIILSALAGRAAVNGSKAFFTKRATT